MAFIPSPIPVDEAVWVLYEELFDSYNDISRDRIRNAMLSLLEKYGFHIEYSDLVKEDLLNVEHSHAPGRSECVCCKIKEKENERRASRCAS